MAGPNWPVPDGSTLCRRQKTVAVQIPCRRSGGNLTLRVDSTAAKMRGDGERLMREHGADRRRQGRQVPLALDAVTGEIRAVEATPTPTGDSPVQPDLLEQLPPDQPIGSVTAYRACDTRICHAALAGLGATAIIPIRRNGRAWKEDAAARARSEVLRATRYLGRALWKRLAGYHARSRIEARMRGLRPFGERIASQDPDRQAAEIHTRIALVSRFSAPRPSRGHARRPILGRKGQGRPRIESCNDAPPRRPEA